MKNHLMDNDMPQTHEGQPLKAPRPKKNGHAPIITSRDDHMGTAKEVLSRFLTTDNHPHIHLRGSDAFVWNGRHYEPVRSGTLSNAIWKALNLCSIPIYNDQGVVSGSRGYNPNRMLVANVHDALLAQVPEHIPARAPSWMGESSVPANELFPMSNGLLHVRTGKLLPPSPMHFNLWASPVKHDAYATCPMWMGFVRDIHEGREDCIDLHQEIFGYYLISSTFSQQFAIIQGIPGTGKSVLLKTLTAMIGPGGFTQMRMEQFGSRDTHAMAQAEGKAVLGVFDARIGPDMNNTSMMGALLHLATGDGIPVRRNLLGGGDSHGKSYAKPILGTNQILRMPDAAIIPRIVLMCLNKVFRGTKDEIPELELRLESELPGIVNWAVKGAQRLMARGRFAQPAYGADILTLTSQRANPFGVFIDNYLTIAGDGRASREDLVHVFNHLHKSEMGFTRDIRGDWLVDQLYQSLGQDTLKLIKKTRYTNLRGENRQGSMLLGISINDDTLAYFAERLEKRLDASKR